MNTTRDAKRVTAGVRSSRHPRSWKAWIIVWLTPSIHRYYVVAAERTIRGD